MRIGTVALRRIGDIVSVGLGDCLNAQVDSGGMCPDGSAYTGVLDSGGAAIDMSTIPNYAQEAVAYGLGPAPTPAPTVASLPLSLPAVTLPKGVTASPTALQTNIVCPAGYVSTGGVCSPITPVSTTIIPGVPNAFLYAGAAFMLLAMMSAGGGGRR